jgi:2-haloacid dehalogenase
MTLDRRTFLRAGAATLALSARALAGKLPFPGAIRAIAFDAFPIFDARPIAAACEREFPGRGAALINAWRTRQFEYQWLRALGGRYVDFWQATADALTFACESIGLDAPGARRDALMQEWLRLDVWPDVPDTLHELKRRGFTLAFLSNATPNILGANLARAGLASLFDHSISTDAIRTFKPDPRAYQLGVDTLNLSREEILFVAFAGWDVAGAKWFGYPTFWNNRMAAPAEQLGVVPDAAGATLHDLLSLLGNK